MASTRLGGSFLAGRPMIFGRAYQNRKNLRERHLLRMLARNCRALA
jgi:hypothetical protein